jgi:hypothetical protein
MPKMEFGQAYCQDLLRRIIRKFILYFTKLYFIFYVFLNFTQISKNFKRKRVGQIGPEALRWGHGPWSKTACAARVNRRRGARPTRGRRAHGLRGGTDNGILPVDGRW